MFDPLSTAPKSLRSEKAMLQQKHLSTFQLLLLPLELELGFDIRPVPVPQQHQLVHLWTYCTIVKSCSRYVSVLTNF